jgi:ribosome-binding ATPase
LLAADLDQAEGRLERVTKQARSGDKEAIAERKWLEAVVDALAAGRPVRSIPPPDAARDAPRHLSALTSKPMLYVANVDEGVDEPPPEVVGVANATGAAVVAISARVESELGELEADEAAELRAELGISEAALDRLVRAAFELLDLIVFFTADAGSPAMARAIRRGATAYDAAGEVHTDLQRGFVRAEVIGWQDLVDAEGYAAARERGLLRTEGRDYLVREGEVVTIKV